MMKRRIDVNVYYELQCKGGGSRHWAWHSDYRSKNAALAEVARLSSTEPDFSWQVVQHYETSSVIPSNLGVADHMLGAANG